MRIKEKRRQARPKKEVNPNSLKAWNENRVLLNDRPNHKELCAKGGRNSAKTKKALRHAKEILQDILSENYSDERISQILEADSVLCKDNNTYTVMMLKALQMANNGNVKAMEFVRDTVGDKPTEDINLNANVITDKDRELLNILGKALNTEVFDTK